MTVKTKASQTGTKVVTGTCRISFPNLFKAVSQNEDGTNPKYSVLLLIPKSDKATIKAIRAAQQVAYEMGVENNVFKASKALEGSDFTLHDCDEEDDLDQYPEREGHYRLACSSREQYRPGVVDADKQPILDASEVYSGCYGRVSMVAYPFSFQGNKGVSFGLRNFQKLADGEVLGGSSASADDDFDDLDLDDDDDDDSIV